MSHAHPDHIGGLAALKKATGAEAHMHAVDGPMAEAGKGFRPMKPAPGFMTGLLFRLFVRMKPVEGAPIEHRIEDGQELSFARDVTAIHVPGHCVGQIALLWREHDGVLFAADACSNMMGLGWSLGHEDFDEGKRSLRKLSSLDFDVACFGHGKAIAHNAARKFKEKWG